MARPLKGGESRGIIQVELQEIAGIYRIGTVFVSDRQRYWKNKKPLLDRSPSNPGHTSKGAKSPSSASLGNSDNLLSDLSPTSDILSAGVNAVNGPHGSYNKGSRLIQLFASANPSTFFHESGHMFLDILTDVASSENAPEQVVQDVNTLMKWFGVKDLETWNQLSFEDRRTHHEKFARGFEAYLREGKAPSSKLMRVFRSFRTWLLGVYEDVRELDVVLTPEVRAVMDRMLASDREIEQVKEVNKLSSLWKERKDFPGTEEQWQQLQELSDNGDELAKAKLTAQYLNELVFMRERVAERRAELEEKYQKALEEAKSRALEEVRNQPIYQALYLLQDNNLGPATRILRSDVKELLGDSLTEKLEKHGVLADDGYPLEDVARGLGYNDYIGFAKELANTPTLNEAVQARANEIMQDEFTEGLSEAERQELATLSALNDLTLQRLEEEYKVVAAAKARPSVLSFAKNWAESRIATMIVKEIEPIEFQRNAEKYANQAVRKAASRDFAGVAEAKRKQLMQAAAQRKALEARQKIRSTEKLAKRLANRQRSMLRKGQQDAEFLDQALGLLSHYGLLRNAKDVRYSHKPQRSFAEFASEWQDQKGVPLGMIDADLFNTPETNYRDMKYEDFEKVRDAVDVLLKQGRRIRSIETRKGKKQIKEIVAKVQELVEDTREERVKQVSPKSRTRQWLDNYFVEHRKLSSMVRILSGGRDSSILHEVITDPLNEAATKEQAMLTDAAKKLRDLVNTLGGANLNGNKVVIRTDKGMEAMTLGTRLAIALNCGNEANMQRLRASGISNAAQVAVLQSLTGKQLEFVQGVWDLLDSYWPQMAELEMRTNGLIPQKVEAQGFTVKSSDGIEMTLKGGYYPIKYDPTESTVTAAQEMEDYAKGIFRGAVTSSATKQGHLKNREKEVNRKLKLDLTVIGGHISEVIHDLSYRETLQDINKLFRDEKFRDLIEDYFGANWYREMADTLMYVAQNGSQAMADKVVGPLLSKVQSNVTFAALAGSLTTVFLQPFGYVQSIQRVGCKYMLYGLSHIVNFRSDEDYARSCFEKSAFMKQRAQTMNVEINTMNRRLSTNNRKLTKAGQWGEKALYWPMQKMQLLVDIPTWWAGYEKARHDGSSDEEAIRIADQTVIDTQGSGNLHDRAKIHREHPILMPFYSYFSATLNLLMESKDRIQQNKIKGSLLFARDIVLLLAIPQMASNLLLEILRGGDPSEKEEEEWLTWLLQQFGGAGLSLFAFLNQSAPLLQGFSYNGPIVTKGLNDARILYLKAARDSLDEEDVAMAGLTLASSIWKIPASQIKRTIKGLEAYSEGDSDTPTSILFGAPPR